VKIFPSAARFFARRLKFHANILRFARVSAFGLHGVASNASHAAVRSCDSMAHYPNTLREENNMLRSGKSFLLTAVAGLLLAMPLAARVAVAKDTKTSTASVSILSETTLAGKQIKPGDYQVRADETKVSIERNGKVIAEAPVQWKDETKKPSYSTVVTTNGQIKEVHFGGKMRYVEIE
jgi:hypothetical protein